jgi:hypothetical protein
VVDIDVDVDVDDDDEEGEQLLFSMAIASDNQKWAGGMMISSY